MEQVGQQQYLTKFQHYNHYNVITILQVGPYIIGLTCKSGGNVEISSNIGGVLVVSSCKPRTWYLYNCHNRRG